MKIACFNLKNDSFLVKNGFYCHYYHLTATPTATT